MTNQQIRAFRVAQRFAPRLFAFGYPVTGRGWRPLRFLALRLWASLLGVRVRRELSR